MAKEYTTEEFHAYIAGLERARLEYVERHLQLLGADPVVAVFHQHDDETGVLRYIYYVHHTEHSGRTKWQLSFVYVDAQGRDLPTHHEIYKTLDDLLTELYRNRAELVEVRQMRPHASNPPYSRLARYAAMWWVAYCFDLKVKTIDRSVQEYLSQFKPARPVTLYRFELVNHDPKQRPIQWPWVSWSHDKKMVEEIVEMENEEQARGLFQVLHAVIPPERIFTDYTYFPDNLKAAIQDAGGDSEMSEVLVYVDDPARPVASNPPLGRPESIDVDGTVFLLEWGTSLGRPSDDANVSLEHAGYLGYVKAVETYGRNDRLLRRWEWTNNRYDGRTTTLKRALLKLLRAGGY